MYEHLIFYGDLWLMREPLIFSKMVCWRFTHPLSGVVEPGGLPGQKVTIVGKLGPSTISVVVGTWSWGIVWISISTVGRHKL